MGRRKRAEPWRLSQAGTNRLRRLVCSSSKDAAAEYWTATYRSLAIVCTPEASVTRCHFGLTTQASTASRPRQSQKGSGEDREDRSDDSNQDAHAPLTSEAARRVRTRRPEEQSTTRAQQRRIEAGHRAFDRQGAVCFSEEQASGGREHRRPAAVHGVDDLGHVDSLQVVLVTPRCACPSWRWMTGSGNPLARHLDRRSTSAQKCRRVFSQGALLTRNFVGPSRFSRHASCSPNRPPRPRPASGLSGCQPLPRTSNPKALCRPKRLAPHRPRLPGGCDPKGAPRFPTALTAPQSGGTAPPHGPLSDIGEDHRLAATTPVSQPPHQRATEPGEPRDSVRRIYRL